MIVRLSEVTKTYRKGVKALDDLSYEVREGEIFGLLGPNGSGKTTSINCLLGLLKFESGTIEIFDQPMGPDRYDLKAQIGVIPQNVAVFYELTVEEKSIILRLYVKKTESQETWRAIGLSLGDIARFTRTNCPGDCKEGLISPAALPINPA